MRFKILLILFCAFLSPLSITYASEISTELVHAPLPVSKKDRVKKLDRGVWQSEISQLDYSKDYTTQTNTNYTPPSLSFIEDLINFFTACAIFLKFLGLIVLVVFIYFIIKRSMVQLNSKSSNIKLDYNTLDLDEVERNLLDIDLDYLLNEAMKANDYRIALRLYYIMCIKSLALKNIIDWKKDKPNGKYVEALQTHALGSIFKDVTARYESIWFGNSFKNEDYSENEEKFIILKNLIDNTSK